MATEIERKFLVSGDEWRLGTTGVLYRQGYLSMHMDRTVRVRLEGEKGTSAWSWVFEAIKIRMLGLRIISKTARVMVKIVDLPNPLGAS